MKKVNYAAIDIGSNAVRLLIKSVNEEGSPEGLLRKVQLIRIPLRLGEDAFTTGEISEGKAEKLIRLMKAYKQLMKIFEVSDYRACATSAMRDARNGKEITRKIEKKTGIRVEIIDGQEEAHIVYDNHIEQLFASGQMRTDLQALAAEYAPIQIIGSGGNINKLFRLADKKDKKQSFLPIESLKEICETLKALSKEERIKQFKLKPDRADVIVPAAEIFLEVAKQVNATGITVPTIGLSDGIIDSLYTKNMRMETDAK